MINEELLDLLILEVEEILKNRKPLIEALQDKWRKNYPSIDDLFTKINNICVPYYRAKGALDFLHVCKKKYLGADDNQIQSIKRDVNDLLGESGRKMNYLRHRWADSKIGPAADVEDLFKEIQYHISPFFEITGACYYFKKLMP